MKRWQSAALCSLFVVLGYGTTYWVAHSRCVTTSRELRASIQVLSERNRTLEAELTVTANALGVERADSDRMFVWYERCLDGRTCTEAGGEPLELNRHHELPALPHMAIKYVPALTPQELAPQCTKGDDELATCYHVAASKLRVRAQTMNDAELKRKTIFHAKILDAEVFGILGTVPGE